MPTHRRGCTNLHCEEGFVDEAEEDAVNFAPGEEYRLCTDCYGSGSERWCPHCGADISMLAYFAALSEETDVTVSRESKRRGGGERSQT